MNNTHTDYQPIFIVGFPRSGTTMLATMLSRHSQISVPPETLFLENIVDASDDRKIMLTRASESRRCRDLGLDWETVTARFMECPATYSWLFRILLETYAAGSSKTIVAEKSPLHLLHVPTLLQWYPRAKIVLIIRDGRDCVLSMVRAPWAHNGVVRHSAEWCRRMRWSRELLQRYGRNIQLIRYEALVTSPDWELRNLMNVLGIPFEPSQLIATASSTAVPAWEAEWKGKSVSHPDPDRIASWRREADSRSLAIMDSVMRTELTAWDYPVESTRIKLSSAIMGAVCSSKTYEYARHLVRKCRSAGEKTSNASLLQKSKSL